GGGGDARGISPRKPWAVGRRGQVLRDLPQGDAEAGPRLHAGPQQRKSLVWHAAPSTQCKVKP
ncbi:MAG: hypothetical protein VW620_01970, partial [Rhodospirillales bacterium]